MCLSWIDTPWSRYTFCTSSTRYTCVSRGPLISMSSFGSSGPSVTRSPAVMSWPSFTIGRLPVGNMISCGSPWSSMTWIGIPLPSSSRMRTTPVARAKRADPRGLRASKSSTTRGKPPAMSFPATPPVWKVRMVSWVPGSPIDCAAITPTASPNSMD